MKRVTGFANLGLVGCDAAVFEYEYTDEEFEDAVSSGEIYDHILRDGVMQVLDTWYDVENVEGD